MSCFVGDLVAQEADKKPATQSTRSAQPNLSKFVTAYCIDCHNRDSKEANFALDQLLDSAIVLQADAWEKVVRKLASQQMPPLDSPRPKQSEYRQSIEQITQVLDQAARENPAVGHVESLRRLTRTEYQNAIRDLLDLEIDTTDLLPPDESSHGFDNITVTNVSPVLLDRYITAARKISRLAIGVQSEQGEEAVYRIRPDVTQDVHIAGTPLGTRGGAVIQHHFPQSGLYEIQIRLMRDRNDEIESLRGKHPIDVVVDRVHLGTVTFERPSGGISDKLVDANLVVKAQVTAGPHQVAVAFPEQSSSLLESPRQPLNVHYNFYRHPRIGPAIYQISILGPFDGRPAENTPSRRRMFAKSEFPIASQDRAAIEVLTNLARRAYRREVTKSDIDSLMSFYKQAAGAGGFDAGIESALSAILVSPHFLFRIENATTEQTSIAKQGAERTTKTNPDSIRALNGYELASRLSFFLWSSIPDDELLALAKQGKLTEPSRLEAQVRRMLADRRSESLSTNFAAQWLYLRNLDTFIPDMRLYPDFDDNLRQAMKKETELLFQNVVHEDASVMQLIRTNQTFLNERLAKHYRIPNVYGSHFRPVNLEDTDRRGGLLRHASILTVTSYATRTSPVIRGHWVLKNLLGNPPPPPPPNVPTLDENNVDATLLLRERLQQHRANPTCASCHNLMDPIGFALENYDAIGRWRDTENGHPIDSKSSLWNGSEVDSVQDIEDVLLAHPELFVQTLTEKLMTHGLGRGIEPMDGPTVRAIVRDCKSSDYRFSDVILGIVKSAAFQKRISQQENRP
ncbi:MAG: DUF1592 domain-containing protein [Pirellulales bacterium]